MYKRKGTICTLFFSALSTLTTAVKLQIVPYWDTDSNTTYIRPLMQQD
uniref:Uncharacterized protein n=1 Tax=Arundo donax TaxID=35708 RepID=A0A0A9F7J7_ARUDO